MATPTHDGRRADDRDAVQAELRRLALGVVACAGLLVALVFCRPWIDTAWRESPEAALASCLAIMREGGARGLPLRDIPINPISGKAAFRSVYAMPAEPLAAGGWIYCHETGELRADVAGLAPSGTAFWHF